MSKLDTAELAVSWQKLATRTPPDVRAYVQQLSLDHDDSLATFFYEQMLSTASAQVFLTHKQVQTRLHQSLKQWLVEMFSAHLQDSMLAVVMKQIKVGEIHARIHIPVYLVLRGARFLKQAYADLLDASPLSFDDRIIAMRYVASFIDMGMEIMSYAYGQSKDRLARAEESYRLFAVVQDATVEHGKQRAAILDWENVFIFQVAVQQGTKVLPRITSSDFGLWFRHKGAYAFEGSTEAQSIYHAMSKIDNELIPLLEQVEPAHETTVQALCQLRELTRSIALELNSLFERHNELESGRDVLTRLLSRKYLPVVLNKEIAYAQKRAKSFALIGIDIDYFKEVNDSYGHEAGDKVLQQFAELLMAHTRSGDYVFRLGGEEFLLVLVDVDEDGVWRIAKKLKQALGAESFHLPQNLHISVTASFGMTMFDGHPDYQHILRRVDAVLYKAKSAGRNCIVFEQ